MTTMSAGQARQQVRVAEVDEVARDVVRLVLVPSGDAPLADWRPGAHIDVETPSGLVRQYSLCGDVARTDEYRVAVLRKPDGQGSVELHDLLPGTQLRVSRPRNDFELRQSPRYLFLAGGIGITPLLSMIEEAEGAIGRLAPGVRRRTRASMAFVDDLVAAYGDRIVVVPEDEQGLLDLPTVLTPTPETLVYCCGPEPLLAAAEAWCVEHWPADSLVLERFNRHALTTPTPSHSAPPVTPGDSIEVQLGCDGPVLAVPADRPILDVLVEAGVDIFYSCQEGICGSCETRVLSGKPDHRDDLLTPQEQAAGSMLVCVSRAVSKRLVLDLEPPG